MSNIGPFPPDAGQCDKCGNYKTWRHRLTSPNGKKMPAHIDANGFLLGGDGDCPHYKNKKQGGGGGGGWGGQQAPAQQYQQPQQPQYPQPQYQQPPPYQQPPQPQYQQPAPQPAPQPAARKTWAPQAPAYQPPAPEPEPEYEHPPQEDAPQINVFPVEALTEWLGENLAGPLGEMLGILNKKLIEIHEDLRGGLARVAETIDHWVEGEAANQVLADAEPVDEKVVKKK